MKYFKEILIVILLIIIGFLLTCNSPKTVYEKVTTIDTVFFPQKERLIKIPVVEYIPVSIKDSNTVVDETEPYFKKYEQPYEDSLIKGTIINTVDGILLSTDLKYVPKFPKLIKEITTTIEKDTVKVHKTVLSVGVRALARPTDINPEILVSLSHKRFIYQVGYNPLNKAPSIGINYKLW